MTGYEAIFERDGVAVSRSPWGPDDNVGRLNLMTPASRHEVLARADASRMFDLAADYFVGMPSWSAAGDPRYQMWMTHTPQGSVNDRSCGAPAQVHEKYSYCGDSISMYGHTGTLSRACQRRGQSTGISYGLGARACVFNRGNRHGACYRECCLRAMCKSGRRAGDAAIPWPEQDHRRARRTVAGAGEEAGLCAADLDLSPSEA